jgi:hypothetical protein
MLEEERKKKEESEREKREQVVVSRSGWARPGSRLASPGQWTDLGFCGSNHREQTEEALELETDSL